MVVTLVVEKLETVVGLVLAVVVETNPLPHPFGQQHSDSNENCFFYDKNKKKISNKENAFFFVIILKHYYK